MYFECCLVMFSTKTSIRLEFQKLLEIDSWNDITFYRLERHGVMYFKLIMQYMFRYNFSNWTIFQYLAKNKAKKQKLKRIFFSFFQMLCDVFIKSNM